MGKRVYEESGYQNCSRDLFVPDEDAYEYALNDVSKLHETSDVSSESFKEYLDVVFEQYEGEKQAFVEWYYSGNWIRKEEGELQCSD